MVEKINKKEVFKENKEKKKYFCDKYKKLLLKSSLNKSNFKNFSFNKPSFEKNNLEIDNK